MLTRPEFLYINLIHYLDAHGLSFRLLIYFFSMVTMGALYFAFKKSKVSIVLATFLFSVYFYLPSFNIARQITAISILLLGYSFLFDETDKKNVWKYLGCVVFATTIHASSIVALLVYPLKKIRVKKNSLILTLIVIFVINTVFPIRFVEMLFGYFSDTEYVNRYGEAMITEGRSLVGWLVEFIKFVLVLIIFIQGKNDSMLKTDFKENLFAFSIVMQILSANMTSNVSRISYVFIVFQIIYIAEYFQTRSTNAKSLVFTAFVVFHVFFCLFDASRGYGNYIPYYLEFNLN